MALRAFKVQLVRHQVPECQGHLSYVRHLIMNNYEYFCFSHGKPNKQLAWVCISLQWYHGVGRWSAFVEMVSIMNYPWGFRMWKIWLFVTYPCLNLKYTFSVDPDLNSHMASLSHNDLRIAYIKLAYKFILTSNGEEKNQMINGIVRYKGSVVFFVKERWLQHLTLTSS